MGFAYALLLLSFRLFAAAAAAVDSSVNSTLICCYFFTLYSILHYSIRLGDTMVRMTKNQGMSERARMKGSRFSMHLTMKFSWKSLSARTTGDRAASDEAFKHTQIASRAVIIATTTAFKSHEWALKHFSQTTREPARASTYTRCLKNSPRKCVAFSY